MMRARAFLLAVLIVLFAEWGHAYFIHHEKNGVKDTVLSLQDDDYIPADQLLLQNRNAKEHRKARSACVGEGGSCDHNLSDCCSSLVCRCNLWGANCRCQKMGLFKK